jgi:7-carboxy-7-deazaguanine synthase
MIRVAETFSSCQGEGKLTGTPSYFIRTSGCNLRCWFCDTPYASWQPSGARMAIDQIVQLVAESALQHVVVTGGEPLLIAEAVELSRMLGERGWHVTIETAGTVFQPLSCDLMSISPKFASSAPPADEHRRWNRLHSRRRKPVETMRRLIDLAPAYQLKFVVDTPDDYAELYELTETLRADPADVWVMPQGSTVEAMDRAATWLRPWCQSQGFQYCDRMQIRWFGNRRGT